MRWFGLWLNFNGYWQGIAPQNELGELNAHLEPTLAGPLQPRRDPLSSIAFYDAMIGEARRAGFDFVKVDNQAANLGWYRGMPAAAECAANNQKALEKSCAFHMDGLINCMAHGTICLFNARLSAVSRCSRDYKLGDPEVAKRHIEQSYASMAWMGPVFWGDHDMFHSNDPCCGALMARSKALSGAPVYLSDAPDRFDYEHVRPLCYANGELLRPLAPASPLPESLFFDPCAEGRAYRVIAPLASASAAFCAYNLTEPNQMVKASVSIRDYERAGQLMQPSRRWEPPAEGLLVYDWASAEAHVLEKNAEYGFSLEGFSDRLLLLCPIRNGWAVVGRSDTYLSPAAVEILDCAEDELIVRMEESGPLTLWSESGFLCCETADFAGAGAGLWTARMKVGERGTTLRVRRKG